MPIVRFICPDGEKISVERCLENAGCRMKNRCAARPYLKLISDERDYTEKITPSAAGNGPRLIYLKQTKPYDVAPESRSFMAIGNSAHYKLSISRFTRDVLAEQKLEDEDMKGIADVLDIDEENDGFYVLEDYKTWGSFKLMKVQGFSQVDKPILDAAGNPVRFKSGKNAGEIKTKKELVFSEDQMRHEIMDTALQLNRYRIFFEAHGFPVSRIWVTAIPRDGGTFVAKGRGLDRNLIRIPVPKISDEKVLEFYAHLQEEVTEAFKTGIVRPCNAWESWEQESGKRSRCEGYCEVVDHCKAMGGW